jgi:hypothetical protein
MLGLRPVPIILNWATLAASAIQYRGDERSESVGPAVRALGV